MFDEPARLVGHALFVASVLTCGPAADVTRTGEAPSAEALLMAADAPRLVVKEGLIRVHAVVQDRNKQPLESDLDIYVQGQDRALCVFREGRYKGRRILLVGNKVWLIVPGTAKPIPISAGQRLLGGASVADVAHLRFASQFTGTLRPSAEYIGSVRCHVVDLVRKSTSVAYGSGTLWIGEEDRLPRRARLALPSGKEAKEILFNSYDHERGRTVLRRMEIRHLVAAERGMVTMLEFQRYEPRALDPGLFDPARAREFP